MNTAYNVLRFLENNKGKFISGGEIASNLGVSRNAVWKAVNALKSEGFDITAVTNKGYMLSEKDKSVSAQSIEKYIKDDKIRVDYRPSVTSTNTILKELGEQGEKEGLLLVSSEQTAGKGRRGRSFFSDKNCGIYFSLLLRPDLSPENSLLITTCAAVAVSEAIEKNTGTDTKIKWVNDIYKNDKKICGILTEAVLDLEGGRVDYAVLGIGINLYFPKNALPDELKNIAGSVFDDNSYTGDTVSRITADTVNIFMREYGHLTEKEFLDRYKKRAYLDGKPITVIKNGEQRKALALGIDDNFRLQVRYEDGTRELLMSGEVSTRLEN